ncbi:MAG: LD-carboxypeptidase [Deltaproteobacteria bacterium]|nr:LD-carboxypeptidase [Deltaproteobacteria bacterium]
MAIIPLALTPGDVISVIAPSGCFDHDAFTSGIEILRQAGFQTRYNQDIFVSQQYLAGSDSRRINELKAALNEPDIKAIWVARGGYGATRIIPHISINQIVTSPRWLIGFSDTTALHSIWSQANIVSIHGANITTLKTWDEKARQELFQLLSCPKPIIYQGEVISGGPSFVRGRLLGGNLTVLAAMSGTGVYANLDDFILMIEDIGERPYRLDRSLTQLRYSGVLSKVRGVAVGQLTNCCDPGNDKNSALQAILSALTDMHLPILAGLPFGHEPSARAVLLGAQAELNTQNATLTVQP